MSEMPQPYILSTVKTGEQFLHVPVIERDPEQRALYKKLGLRRHIGMTVHGGMRARDGMASVAWSVQKRTPYTDALHAIDLEEKAAQIPEGTYFEALDLMLDDCFDDSDLAARYFPGQND